MAEQGWVFVGSKAAASAVRSSLTHRLAQLLSGMWMRWDGCFHKSLQSLSSPLSSLEAAPLSLLGNVWQAALYCLALVCPEK